jgi:lysyl-tRNA synthetase class 2
MNQPGSPEGHDLQTGAAGGGHGDQLHEWERERLAKLERLREQNIEPYARSYPERTSLAEIAEQYGYLETGQTAEGTHYRVAGRVMARRRHGKALFLTLRDDWNELQVYSNVNTLGESSFERLTEIDLGDIIGCTPCPRSGMGYRTARSAIVSGT